MRALRSGPGSDPSRSIARLALAGCLLLAAPSRAAAGDAAEGRRLFGVHCAPCHGTGARGDGPVARALRRPPADLTRLAGRHGGEYPARTVARAIDGRRAIGAHGDRVMPIWGAAFAARAGEMGGARRIEAIVAYLASIQAAPAGR